MMILQNVYLAARGFLARHKKLSLILSHGGMHLAVLLLLTVAIIVFSVQINRMSKRDYVVTHLSISDRDSNSVVTRINLDIEPCSKESTDKENFRNVFSILLSPQRISIERTAFADLKQYVDFDEFYFSHQYLELAKAIVNDIPDSLFYRHIELPAGEDRQLAKARLNDSIAAADRKMDIIHTDLFGLSNKVPEIYSEPTVADNMLTLRTALPLKSTAYNDGSADKNINITIQSDKVFGGTIINRGKITRDSTLTIIPMLKPAGLSIEGTMDRINTSTFFVENNFWGKHEGNPFFMGRLVFDIPCHRFDDYSTIVLDFTPETGNASSVVAFDRIYPEPTRMFVNKVEYRGAKAVEEAVRSGIYVEARNVTEAYKTDRLYILYSVLLGTFLAFALDIIIQLIYKWRRLSA